ncbi:MULTISPECIES: hypothetical protein [Burkholderiaceae]|jgi:hypothetical protein|uniref:Uncharacterized protein n=1 Tax=Caballeronia sordidicola TaxID=196367 RepID=A0A242NAY1_CABSO|nr:MULTISPECIES: hypothetical protein [Burkholderiaceae]MDP9153922.1 hypothetical protein [Pseudomonadota bacterium]AME24280.1 hypothetical protein AXG89_10945 [Burkholderia sp. PAMC 26561]AMM13502.1 hypothetical protein AX768_04695 [Burkholderia sp. PAMC 28687]OTP69917.1 hypothetical protein PAMC26577_29775 [Caballeronia sordidicola]OTP80821.1 hypothetical protein PAMC26510_01060 [Caballeronia sordidicola]
MHNDLTEFELDWLLELAINGSGRIPATIAAHFRELGYAELIFSTTCVTRKGRETLMAGMQAGAGSKIKVRPGVLLD